MGSKFEKCQCEHFLLEEGNQNEKDKGNGKGQRMGLQKAHPTVPLNILALFCF